MVIAGIFIVLARFATRVPTRWSTEADGGDLDALPKWPGHSQLGGQVPRMTWEPSASDTPFDRLGGADAVRRLAEAFYDAMDRDEPALAHLHELDSEGRVCRRARDRFALFFIEWLGGPADFSTAHGHPRLRMRHASVPVDSAMRDAWMRAMRRAMEAERVAPDVREFLDKKLSDLADFLRNRGDS